MHLEEEKKSDREMKVFHSGVNNLDNTVVFYSSRILIGVCTRLLTYIYIYIFEQEIRLCQSNCITK